MELEMLNDFVMQLAMCEMLSANFVLEPSMAQHCTEIQTFIKESYFDNNYQAFITWWDKTVVPITQEFQSLYEKTL
tara:strand:+ start:329 stop:556 length:228 start_codon:yes stop_codon:yes gene_type:complete